MSHRKAGGRGRIRCRCGSICKRRQARDGGLASTRRQGRDRLHHTAVQANGNGRQLLARLAGVLEVPQGDLDSDQSAHRQAPHRRGFPQELRVNTNDTEMFIRFQNGSTWQCIGSDRYDRRSAPAQPASSTASGRSPIQARGLTTGRCSRRTTAGLFHHDAARTQPRQHDVPARAAIANGSLNCSPPRTPAADRRRAGRGAEGISRCTARMSAARCTSRSMMVSSTRPSSALLRARDASKCARKAASRRRA